MSSYFAIFVVLLTYRAAEGSSHHNGDLSFLDGERSRHRGGHRHFMSNRVTWDRPMGHSHHLDHDNGMNFDLDNYGIMGRYLI